MNFEHIYDLHKEQVYNLALNYVQQIEDAQEITQDVFVSVHKNHDSFREEAKLSTWIYRITINKCLDFIKAKKAKKRGGFLTSLFYDDGFTIKHDAASFNHPGVELEDKEAMIHLFNCINSLPETQKTALILHKLEDKSQGEVAEIMGSTPKAIESLIQRAKVNLEKKLAESKG